MVERKCGHVGICERVISGVESMRQSVYSASLCGSHGCGLHSGGEGGERDEKCVVCMTLRQAGRRTLWPQSRGEGRDIFREIGC